MWVIVRLGGVRGRGCETITVLDRGQVFGITNSLPVKSILAGVKK